MLKRLNSRLVAGLFLALVTFVPSQVSAATTVPAKIVEPSPTNFQTWTFDPGTLTVHVGDAVLWTNTGQANHTVTANSVAFDSGNVAPGATFAFTFTKAGTYDYKCSYHPWMKGTVDVLAAGQVVASPTPIAPTATPKPLIPTRILPTPTTVPPTATARPASVNPAAQSTLAPTATGAAATPILAAASPSVQPTDTAAVPASPIPASAPTTPPVALSTPTTIATIPTTISPPAANAVTPTAPPTAKQAGGVSPAALGGGIVGLLILAAVGITLARRRG